MPKAASPIKRTAPPRSSLLLLLGVGWCVLTLGALLLLKGADLTLGQGSFYYRYSQVESLRMLRVLPLALPALLLLLSLHWIGRNGWRRWAGGAAAGLLPLLLSGWTWWAPPQPFMQHTFNMRSPSHEGAFFLETLKMKSLGDYLRGFDELIQRSSQEMGGTRVISNPPGMTVFAVAMQKWFPPQVDPPGMLEEQLLQLETPAWDLALTSNTIRLSLGLTALWMLSGYVAYALGRVFLPAPGALLFALIACFNPCTVHFVPGKDPAQLLTINALLLAWLMGRKRDSIWLSTLAGLFLALGLALGLIHFWIALALLAATIWERGIVPTLLRQLLPALLGAGAFMLAVYLACGWNLPATLLAVARRFGPIQQTFVLDRTIWFFIGLPIFLLFISPGLAAALGLTIRRRQLGFGAKLALCTAGAMVLTYVTGVTYELPRLWVAFLPPLTLGAMIDLPLLRAIKGKALTALMLLAALQLSATALHWSRLDVRESEYRLISKRFFN